MFTAYEKACKRGEVTIGKMFVVDTGQLDGPKHIINFPTKKHWRAPSKLAYIDAGLIDLIRVIRELNIASVAVPRWGWATEVWIGKMSSNGSYQHSSSCPTLTP